MLLQISISFSSWAARLHELILSKAVIQLQETDFIRQEYTARGRARAARRKARHVRWAARALNRRERESLRSARAAFFFWALFFWASKRKVPMLFARNSGCSRE